MNGVSLAQAIIAGTCCQLEIKDIKVMFVSMASMIGENI
jgi:hypothetical protein